MLSHQLWCEMYAVGVCVAPGQGYGSIFLKNVFPLFWKDSRKSHVLKARGWGYLVRVNSKFVHLASSLLLGRNGGQTHDNSHGHGAG